MLKVPWKSTQIKSLRTDQVSSIVQVTQAQTMKMTTRKNNQSMKVVSYSNKFNNKRRMTTTTKMKTKVLEYREATKTCSLIKHLEMLMIIKVNKKTSNSSSSSNNNSTSKTTFLNIRQTFNTMKMITSHQINKVVMDTIQLKHLKLSMLVKRTSIIKIRCYQIRSPQELVYLINWSLMNNKRVLLNCEQEMLSDNQGLTNDSDGYQNLLKDEI